MTKVTPYEHSTDSKRKQVEKMFDNISDNYDFLNRSLSFGIDIWWRKKMLGKLKGIEINRLLDIATGTGDVAIAASKQLNPKSIIGVDISDGMLAVGRVKIEKKGLSQIIELQNADSENLPFESNSFDAVTVAFGVRNFEHLSIGLQEMNRVLRPGGKVVILEFSRPRIFPIRQLYDFYFRYFCPWWGKLISKDNSAYRYLYESVSVFPEGDEFLTIAKNSGFKDLQAQRVTFGIVSLYTGIK
ncbi:MAG TPA: bifunctional demethylmenaquinone methyltransferase/2-methoxy-6-polyprenyl-1,4-benzoquinol methylase UbiE [Flavobacteriales bacterium]|nr:bifunctional demethylmenaquinone methyltransferase/2-methoxy-6-polyprenyl-1,4-benzoquinol methylase UbiE [Flavobacteriales bacterium]HPH81641.1 bifunctional demethylmenaquinone methyltransferase/2-methoxy-6-polyprenyl-1,4-benzoquinol methylase UbiE [Flavobacteriales bacterium]